MLFFVWILFFDLLFLFWLLVDFHKFICHTISKINNAFYMLPHIFNIVGNRQFHLAQEVLMYLSDIHTHSIASGHGTNCTISDMAKEAGRKGLKLLGISDHGPVLLFPEHLLISEVFHSVPESGSTWISFMELSWISWMQTDRLIFQMNFWIIWIMLLSACTGRTINPVLYQKTLRHISGLWNIRQ